MSYVNFGPFTSYAPTYDSSFANISKDDSDLICSLYGEESSLQGSDRYVQYETSSVALTQDVARRHSWLITVQMVLCFTLEEVSCELGLVLTPNHQFLHFGFFLRGIIISWYFSCRSTLSACNLLSFCIQAK